MVVGGGGGLHGDDLRLDEGRLREFGRQDAEEPSQVDGDRPAEGGQGREGEASDAPEEDDRPHDDGRMSARGRGRLAHRETGSHGHGEGVAQQVERVE